MLQKLPVKEILFIKKIGLLMLKVETLRLFHFFFQGEKCMSKIFIKPVRF